MDPSSTFSLLTPPPHAIFHSRGAASPPFYSSLLTERTPSCLPSHPHTVSLPPFSLLFCFHQSHASGQPSSSDSDYSPISIQSGTSTDTPPNTHPHVDEHWDSLLHLAFPSEKADATRNAATVSIANSFSTYSSSLPSLWSEASTIAITPQTNDFSRN